MPKLLSIFSLLFISKILPAQTPVYTVSSPQNFIITCGNPTVTIYITSPSAPGYTFTVVTPGNYTFSVMSGTVTTLLPISIVSDTVAPSFVVTSTGSVLSCVTTSIQLQGASSGTNVNYLWSSAQGSSTNNVIVVNANYSIPASTAPFGNYSLTVTNPGNQCTSNTVISIYQNTYKPNAAIVRSDTALTCQIYSVTLSNSSSSSIPMNSIFPRNQSVTAINWAGPPWGSGQSGNSFVAYTPGVYSLTVRDLNNGCTSSTTIPIGDNRIYPLIVAPFSETIACPNGTVTLNTFVQGNPASFLYNWSAPAGATTSGNSSASLTINAPGVYTLMVTNNKNYCQSQTFISVYACVGLEESSNASTHIVVFPNPFQDRLFFEINSELQLPLNLKIINALGQIEFSKTELDIDESLDLNFLRSGFYFIHISSGIETRVFRIIKN